MWPLYIVCGCLVVTLIAGAIAIWASIATFIVLRKK